MISIESARSTSDYKLVLSLIAEYVAWLDIDLSFQNYAEEMASFPGYYVPPKGDLILAKEDSGTLVEETPLGCVALRPMAGDGCCEMKRLWVTPEARGKGIARLLVSQAIKQAESMGYREMRLDTLSHMTEARALYQKFGFVEIEPYYKNPHQGASYMSKKL